MTDVAHFLGGDLQLGPTGDLAVVDGANETQQRLLRRLLTNPGDYIWHLGYGAGLGAMVGKPANALRIRAVIRGQVFQEKTVGRTPPPTVTVAADLAGLVSATITYADITGTTQILTVPPKG